MLKKIISGGQTGADRAGLDVAIKNNIKHGGYCPKDRIAEDGTISKKYNLTETDSKDVSQRTKKNIEDSDGTIVFVPKLPLEVNDGTKLTIEYAELLLKPLLIVDLSSENVTNEKFCYWLKENNISVLNVAGPRESNSKGLYNATSKKLNEMLNFALEVEKIIEPKENIKPINSSPVKGGAIKSLL